MTPPRNSNAVRDIANVLHPYTDAKAHQVNGPLVISRGKGVRIFDEQGKEYIEAMAGLWCTSLGFDNERLVQAATNRTALSQETGTKGSPPRKAPRRRPSSQPLRT